MIVDDYLYSRFAIIDNGKILGIDGDNNQRVPALYESREEAKKNKIKASKSACVVITEIYKDGSMSVWSRYGALLAARTSNFDLLMGIEEKQNSNINFSLKRSNAGKYARLWLANIFNYLPGAKNKKA